MKKKIYLLGFILFILLNISFYSTIKSESNTIETFALNHNTKKCCVFDNNAYTEIPSGWEKYPFDSENFFYEIDTSFGSCRFEKYSDYTETNWKKCCEQLNLEFVEYNNFNKEFLSILKNDFSCKEYEKNFESDIAIDSNNAKCTLLSCYMGNVGKFKKYNNGLEIYSAQQQIPTIILETKAGECHFNIYKPQECCKQLGYTYIDKNFSEKKDFLNNWHFFLKPIYLVIILLFLTFVIIKYINH